MNRRLREETFWQIKGRLSAGVEIVKVAELFGLNKTTIRNVARSLSFEEFRLFSTGKYKNSDIEEYRRKKALEATRAEEAEKSAKEEKPSLDSAMSEIKKEEKPQMKENEPDKIAFSYQFNRIHDDLLGIYSMVLEKLTTIERNQKDLMEQWR